MIIAGIDPGPETSGICVWDTDKQEIIVSICNGLNEGIGYVDDEGTVFRSVNKYVIEDIKSYGMPVGEKVFGTLRAIGRLQERLGNPVMVFKRDIQLHFCNTTRSKDANIRRVLIDRFGAKGTKRNPGITYGLKEHAWDGFALCIWYEDNRHSLSGGVL